MPIAQKHCVMHVLHCTFIFHDIMDYLLHGVVVVTERVVQVWKKESTKKQSHTNIYKACTIIMITVLQFDSQQEISNQNTFQDSKMAKMAMAHKGVLDFIQTRLALICFHKETGFSM